MYLAISRIRNERGASMVEYALLLALVAVIAIAGITLFGTAVADSFQSSNDSIDAIPSP